MRKVIIAGGRYFDNYNLLSSSCSKILGELSKDRVEILSGGAKGADELGERFAKERGIPVVRYLPDWDKNGRAAGPIRNHEMAYVADILIAFWDGKSKGTANMIKLANLEGCIVHVVNY